MEDSIHRDQGQPGLGLASGDVGAVTDALGKVGAAL